MYLNTTYQIKLSWTYIQAMYITAWKQTNKQKIRLLLLRKNIFVYYICSIVSVSLFCELSINNFLSHLKCTLCHIFCVTKTEEKQIALLLTLGLWDICCSLTKAKYIFIASYKYSRNSISASRLPSARSDQAVRDIYWFLYVYWEKSILGGWAGKQFRLWVMYIYSAAFTLLLFPCVNHCMGSCWQYWMRHNVSPFLV